MFTNQPERLAAAWRRVLYSRAGNEGVPDNLLDGVVEDFIRQTGRALEGVTGDAWNRTRGVLRISTTRGVRALIDEFGALRRCMLDALNVLGAPPNEASTVAHCVQQAAESAAAYHRRLIDPGAPAPKVHFGGLVVEVVEPRKPPVLVLQPSRSEARRPASGTPSEWPLRGGA
ncbi:MAG: hypothetical protein WBV82_22680 [Myxococcaceae bacterium]